MKAIIFGSGLSAVLFGAALHAGLDNPVAESPEMMRVYAEMGDPGAQYNLALLNQEGEGAKQDMAQAVAWYRKAAASGFALAQNNLAVLLNKGEGVTKDEKEAVKWFYAAAWQGVFSAQKAMIECYARGVGVEKNPVQALTWDFLARRSLELRYEQPAGEPPKPAKLRTDGFAEFTTPQGQREAIGPDGSVEKTNADGTKTVQRADGGVTEVSVAGVRATKYPNGRRVTEYPDGRRETRLPDGGVLTEYPDGRRETRLPDGVVVTEYPNGRKVAKSLDGAVETLFPDGTREVEGDATTAGGNSVRFTDKFDKDGKRLSRRFVDRVETIEEHADGTRLIETIGEDEQHRKIRVIDAYNAEGVRGERRLVREDGVDRSGEEIWVIIRRSNGPNGAVVVANERYGAGNSILGQEVIETFVPATPARMGAVVAVSPVEIPEGAFFPGATNSVVHVKLPPTVIPQLPPWVTPQSPGIKPRGSGDGTAKDFRPNNPSDTQVVAGADTVKAVREKIPIDTQLADLARLERQALYFAGATEADFERARAMAQRFVFNLQTVPQKPLPANVAAARFALRGSPPPLPGFVRMATDRSELHPFGLHGRVAIKLHPWQHTETEHFVVHYIDPKEAYSVMGDIECTFINVTQTLQLDAATVRQKSHVFIFPDAAAWKAFKEPLGLPEAVAGFAYKAELYLGARDDREKYLHTLCHEAAHAVVARFYPGRKWPLWLNEGFAEYMSTKQLELRPREKPDTSTPRPLWHVDVDRVFYRTEYGIGGEKVTLQNGARVDSTALFYAESERCVRALIEKLPPRSFPRFGNLVFAGNSMPICLSETYGAACPDSEKFEAVVNSK